MRSKQIRLSFNPDEEVRNYLVVTGYIDARTGKKKSKARNLNNMLNNVLRYAFTTGLIRSQAVTTKDLKIAHLKMLNKLEDEKISKICRNKRQISRELDVIEGKDSEIMDDIRREEARKRLQEGSISTLRVVTDQR